MRSIIGMPSDDLPPNECEGAIPIKRRKSYELRRKQIWKESRREF